MSEPIPPGAPAVELRDLTVRFGECVACRRVSLLVPRGQVHALVGENGAGKSTLMRALFGLVEAEEGEVRVDGERVARPSPQRMMARGVGMVHQHFMLVPPLTVAENVVLGDEPVRGGLLAGLLDRARAEREVAALARRHGMDLDPSRPVEELSVGEQQRVEILKALRRDARVLILDEPTAVLTPPEVGALLELLRGFARGGGTVLLVTHKLDEVRAVADAATVMRRGEVVARFGAGQGAAIEPAALARAMVGRDPAPLPARSSEPEVDAPARLSVSGLVSGVLGREEPVSFEVRPGEILGVAGVEGNGQGELIAALLGVAPVDKGRVSIDGAEVTGEVPAARRARGLGCVPEDRQRLGLLLARSLADNVLLGREERYGRWYGIDSTALARETAALLAEHDVRPADAQALARSLSGGNQQKLVLARELARRPTLLVAAQPTRGVDVGAIEHIHRRLDEVRARGGAVLLLSADLDELLALSDRVAVLYRGRLVAVLPRSQATVERLGAMMMGVAGPGAAA